MEKFRITDCGTLEIRRMNNRIVFSTTPDYLEVVADLSKEKALLIAEKICAWASDIPVVDLRVNNYQNTTQNERSK